MKCCVLSCKSYSDRRSDAMDGITFHVFPSEDNLKQQWIAKINRKDWTPTKYTKICSCHFNDDDFTVTKKGFKKLKQGTLPSINLDISIKRKLPEPSISPPRPTTSDLNEFLIFNDSPRKKKLKREIEQLRWKSKKDGLKIRRLQMKVKRLKKKTDIKGFLNKKQMDDNSKGIAKDVLTLSVPIKCSVNVKVEKCDHYSMNENGPVKEVVNYGGTFSMDECGVNISEPAGIGTDVSTYEIHYGRDCSLGNNYIPEKDLEVFMSGLEDGGSNSKEVDDDIIILDDGGPVPVSPNENEKCEINTLQEQLDAEIQKYVEMDAAISKVFKTSNCYRRFKEKETEQPLEDNVYDDNDDDDLMLLNNSDEVTIISDSDDENKNENSKEFVEDNVKIINSIEREESNTNFNTKVKEEPNYDANISCRKDGTIEAHPEHNEKVDTLTAKDNSEIETYNVVKESHSGQSIIAKRKKEDNVTCPHNEDRNTELGTNVKNKPKHVNIKISGLGNGTYASYLQDKDCSMRHSIEVKEEPGDASCLQDTELNLHHSPGVKDEREDEIIMSHSSDDSNASYPQDVEFNLNHTTEIKVEAIDDIVMFYSGDETALCPQEVHYDKVNIIGMKGPVCDAALSCGENKRLAKRKCIENLKKYAVRGVSDKGDSREPIKKKHNVSIVNVEVFYSCKKCPFRGCYNDYIEHITSSCVAMSFYCSTCITVFSTLKLYVHHLTRHNYKFLTCPNCKRQFNEDSRLCSHIISHLTNFYMKSQDVQNMDLSPSQKNDILQCIECKKIIKSEQIFIHWDLHLKMKNDKRKVDDNKDSDDEAEMNSNLTKELLDMLLIKKTINMPRKCIVCNKTFRRPRDCKRHFIVHLLFQALRSKVKDDNQLLCQLCGADQNNPAKYKEHMREHASMAIHKCQICAKTFSDKSNYCKHVKVHNLYSFICDKCGKKFHLKKCLIDHLQMHESRPPASCLQCDMSFSTGSKLKRHLKYKHMRDCRYYACMICKKRLGSLKEKWDHMWLEHQERKIKVDCSLCNMKFRKISDLKQHVMKVHLSQLSRNSFSELVMLKRDYE